MAKYEELKIDGANVLDLIRSSYSGQRININGHYYVIGEVTTDFTDPHERCLVKMKRVNRHIPYVSADGHVYDYSNKITPVETDQSEKSDKLVELVRTFRDSTGDGKIKMLDQKKYVQLVINLVEGLPASKVAESLDKAAEYVRNQAVTGHWDDNSD